MLKLMLETRFGILTHVRFLKRTHYDVLGVKREASLKEIKAAFYQKSKQHHPDNAQNGGKTDNFVELKTAYDCLRKPADRRMYDYQLKNGGVGGDRHENGKYQYYRHPYSARPQYDFSRDWSTYWNQAEQPNHSKSAREERDKSSREFMKSILKWTAFGVVLVVGYNGGYLYLLSWQQKQIDKLVDEDEIAKCFLRQKEFRDKDFESSEVAELGRLLKADVDEIWKNRVDKNPNEIREEYRWFRALQDPEGIRQLKEKRAEKKHEERNRWRYE